MNVVDNISMELHKRPSEVEEWPLPDICRIMAKLYEKAQQIEQMNKDLENQTQSQDSIDE